MPVDERRREPEPLRGRGHLLSAAVDDHGVDPDVLEQRQVARERRGELRLLHHGAPHLHHDARPAMLLEERQRLQERARLRDGPFADLRRERPHVVYSALIRT
jgi:hypothetical protein